MWFTSLKNKKNTMPIIVLLAILPVIDQFMPKESIVGCGCHPPVENHCFEAGSKSPNLTL